MKYTDRLVVTKLIVILIFVGSGLAKAQTDTNKNKTISIGPLGSKPIQISIDKDGLHRKEGGYICDLDAINGHYSEWGETEQDGQNLVMHTCSQKSGLLLCKKNKITCKKD